MSSIISVDGNTYNVKVRTGEITREANILDGKNAGRLKSGEMDLDTICTFYNYAVTFLRDKEDFAAYDSLYEVLSDPIKRTHTVIMPYAQSTITFSAYVANVSDALLKQVKGKNYWDEMKVAFVAIKPYRRA